MRKPDFIYVGAAKAGTSWLFNMLSAHPDCYLPPAKDTEFFTRQFNLGENWYLRHFGPGESVPVCGEISPYCFEFPEVAGRIREMLPEVRILACLRNPLRKAVSWFHYRKCIDLKKDVDFATYAFAPETLRGLDYRANLEPYFQCFPREQIKVLVFDDLELNPQDFLAGVYTFLGLDPHFTPPDYTKKVLNSPAPRLQWLSLFSYTVGQKLRGLGMANTVGAVGGSSWFRKLMYKTQSSQEAPEPEVLRQLAAHLTERHQGLSKLLGRPIPSNWYDADSVCSKLNRLKQRPKEAV